MTFSQYLLFKESNSSYSTMLDRIEQAVGGVMPSGFNTEADDEAFRARKDVLDVINKLRTQIRFRHVA